MIKKNGKTYVILEFREEADAAYFETSFFDRAPGDLVEASAQARINDNAFNDNTVSNTNTAPVHGVLNQIGVVGNRVQ